MLDGTEARHLGSLSHDTVINQEMLREAYSCSLWERVLGSVAQRYLCADDLYMQQTQWKTIEQGIQRLREMAVAEIVFSDDINTRNPDLLPCTPVMWRKLVRLGPQEYSSALAIMKRDDTEKTVLDMAKKLRAYADGVHGPTQARIAALEMHMRRLEDKIEENHKKLREDILQISAVQVRGSGTTRKCSPGLLKVEEQQVHIATATVNRRQYRTTRDTMIPIHKMIHELETQGVVSKTHSPFNSPIWPVHKSDGEWRLTVHYRALNEVTPPLSAAVPDMLELQYELESKAAKWYATIDIANAFFSIPLSE
ncbi:hypothetical protein DUI87_19218 [Hirundo rustica rustica]|uniref:Reverse transcriptase domain-containing protein n=1 Tax=Hirundo rustica rustica TaxID=333673 RepID=A0A3M0KB54_HIRRU|nr:hypothetical protein DUI87_19218 [Hirundo rustica rustica]